MNLSFGMYLLSYDIIFPIAKIIMFFLILFRIHKIDDDSTFHEILDFIDVFVGLIWTALIACYIGFCFFTLLKIA